MPLWDVCGKRPAAFPGTRNQVRHVARSDGQIMAHQQYWEYILSSSFYRMSTSGQTCIPWVKEYFGNLFMSRSLPFCTSDSPIQSSDIVKISTFVSSVVPAWLGTSRIMKQGLSGNWRRLCCSRMRVRRCGLPGAERRPSLPRRAATRRRSHSRDSIRWFRTLAPTRRSEELYWEHH